LNGGRIDPYNILFVKLTFSEVQDLQDFKFELFQNTYFLQRLNHSSHFSSIYTRDKLALYRIEEFLSSLKHSKAELWYAVHSRNESGSEMKGLNKVIFLVCFTLCLSPGGRRDFEILYCKMSLK
jgi:hypothetical protein